MRQKKNSDSDKPQLDYRKFYISQTKSSLEPFDNFLYKGPLWGDDDSTWGT